MIPVRNRQDKIAERIMQRANPVAAPTTNSNGTAPAISQGSTSLTWREDGQNYHAFRWGRDNFDSEEAVFV